MISLIVAMNKEHVIGVDNGLPWHIPQDLKLFKRYTKGHPIIMGRKTFESIGRPLPLRTNIVISRSAQNIPNVTIASSPKEALKIAQALDKEVYVIGGASIYAAFLPFADRLLISWVDQSVNGDVFFPDVEWSEFKESSRQVFDEFEHVTYLKI